MEKHIFAICAYGKSEYLEECIKSVKNQKHKSKIILATSTPNEYINELCARYDIPQYINTGEAGITQDWNFAYSKADAQYVTITHQDDVYLPDYAEKVIAAMDGAKKPIIAFTDYGEIRNGEAVDSNRLLNIKRVMLLPLRLKALWNSKFIRRRILAFGSAICCPSVTFCKGNCPETVFQHGFRASEDWQAWEMLSKRKGAFVFCNAVLMRHRIHEDSETTKILGDHARLREDYEMFCKFWPQPIAKLILKAYGTSEQSNELEW